MHNTSRFLRHHLGALLVATAAVAVGGGSLALAQSGAPSATGGHAEPAPVTTDADHQAAAAGPAVTPEAGHDAGAATRGRDRGAADPARRAWALRYGVDRAVMSRLAPVAEASPEELAAASDLLGRTVAATARYADPEVAEAAGFDVQASLARKDKKMGRRQAHRMTEADPGPAMTSGRMPMLHVGNGANKRDGRVLDPSAPETLMYADQGQGDWKLVGVMYAANESYPEAPPDPGGPITRWHHHSKDGAGQRLMMHLFFVPDGDLARAYATTMRR